MDDNVEEGRQTIWTDEMVKSLLECRRNALSQQEEMKKTGRKVSYMQLMHSLWMAKYSTSKLTSKNLQSRLYQEDHPKKPKKSSRKKSKKSTDNLIPKQAVTGNVNDEMTDKNENTPVDPMNLRPKNMSIRDKSVGRPVGTTRDAGYGVNDPGRTLFTKTDMIDQTEPLMPNNSNVTGDQNMPQNMQYLMRYRMFGEKHSAKPLISNVCYSCGQLLYGNISEGHKFSVITKVFPVCNRYLIPPTLSYMTSRNQVTSCRRCKEGPKDYYPCGDVEGKLYIPGPIKSLQSAYEISQISLAGIFSCTLRRVNTFKKSWDVRKGETNVLSKMDHHYKGMYGYLVEKEKPKQTDQSSFSRIKAALTWLRQNNPLFTSFFAKMETLFRYDTDKSTIPSGSHLDDAKGRSMEHHLGKETHGLVIPQSLEDGTTHLKPNEDTVGTQHPKLITENETGQAKTIEPSNFTYTDKYLEAKAFPHLFPFGTGSWYTDGGLTMTEYVKMRLLDHDERWRKDRDWSFFWYDRLTKARLFYNARSRSIKRTAGIKVSDIWNESKTATNPYDKYGTEVPPSIQGSRSYWTSRLLDLLTMSKKLGPPSYFITLTQNDSWSELQTCIEDGLGSCSETLTVDDPPAARKHNPCMFNSVETAIAFEERFKLFKEKILSDPEGPLGHVKDYWYRREYQFRGGKHIHMVVWVTPGTEKPQVVRAEMPRGDLNDPFVRACRKFVQDFQIHQCDANRCYKGPGGKTLTACKYGFPFSVLDQEKLDESEMRTLYVRRQEEDSRVVPYSLETLLLMQSHVNIQKVTSGGWEMYMAKYISKSEPSFDMKSAETDMSATERFLRTRIVGRLEAIDSLLGFQLARASRDVVYLPTQFTPSHGILKRRQHMPTDPDSTEIYYDTLLDKYLDRPSDLKHLLYPEYVERYSVLSSSSPETAKSKASHTDQKERLVQERQKHVLTRWCFYLPFGNNSELYYQQKIVLSLPLTREDLPSIISQQNKSKTYLEECVIRGLLNKKDDGMKILESVAIHGYSLERMRDIANLLIQIGWVTNDICDSFLQDIVDTRPAVPSETMEVQDGDEENEEGMLGDLKPCVHNQDLDQYVSQFTTSQRNAYDWIKEKITKDEQVLACVVGQAGTGKSFLINGLTLLLKEKQIPVVKLATTGVAAFLIKGQTVHSLFQMDINCKSYLEKGTAQYQLAKSAKVLIIDEFSMMEYKLFVSVEKLCRRLASGTDHNKLFGGRHIILTGDPCQLPAIDKNIYDSYLWPLFSPLVLKDVKRQNDPLLKKILDEIRFGLLTRESVDILKSRVMTEKEKEDIDPMKTTLVVSLRQERDMWNSKFLAKMEGTEYVFEAIDTYTNGDAISEVDKERIKKYHRERLPDTLKLKVGAKAVLVKNIDTQNGWVNGSLCEIVDIKDQIIIIKNKMTNRCLPISRASQNLDFKGGVYVITRQQFPLILGFCLTSHKVQGLTLENVTIQLSKSFFASGQGYVALSRAKSLEQISLIDFQEEAIHFDLHLKEVLVDILQRDKIGPVPIPPILLMKESGRQLKRTSEHLYDKSSHNMTKDNMHKKFKTEISKGPEVTETSPQASSCSVPTKSDTEVKREPEKSREHAEPVASTCHHTNSVQEDPHKSMAEILTSREEVDDTGFTRHRVGGTGDCFYRCLSCILYGNENHHQTVRKRVCDFMKIHPTRFVQYYDNANLVEFLDHILQQDNQGAWATQVEVFAAASLLQVPVYIYMRNGRQKTWLLHEPVMQMMSNATCKYYVAIVNDSNMHYDVLLPKNGLCTCQTTPPQLEGTLSVLPVIIN